MSSGKTATGGRASSVGGSGCSVCVRASVVCVCVYNEIMFSLYA